MHKIRAILVDDESSARDVLENLLHRFCPEVELLAKCENMLQAVEVIREKQPQLVFLDIEMPNYAGYEITKFFKDIPFKLVFVTAYDKYAIRAFEVAAMDYLLKPIDIERLKTAVSRALKEFKPEEQIHQLPVLGATLESRQIKNISISDRFQHHIVAVDSIIALEAQESYCVIHTTGRKYTVSKNLRHYELLFEALPQFIRTHKSWIINRNYMKHYSKTELTITLEQGIVARLSKYKKAEFEDILLK